MRLKKALRAVSPVIATLLLVAIAVAGSVVTYSWVMSMVRTQGGQAQTGIKIESVEFAKTGNNKDTVIVTVRNTGSVDAKIATIYIIDSSANQYKADYGVSPLTPIVITPNKISAFTLTYSLLSPTFGWSTSSSYTVRVVTDNGFVSEGSYTSPAS